MNIKRILGVFIGMIVAALAILTILFYKADQSFESLYEKYAYPDSKILELEGMPVHYRIVGTGKPLLLLHGTAASIHTWEGWIEELKNDFQLIAVDLPAFGLTGPHPSRDYSLDAYADFLDLFTQHIGLDSFFLAGNSLGGAIAWRYTTLFPEKVQKLILLDAGGYPRESKPLPLPMRLAQKKALRPILLKFTPRFLVKNSLLDVYADDSKVTEDLVNRYFDFQVREGNRQAFIDRARTQKRVDPALIKTIKQPVLIQWGDQDNWIAVDLAHRFHEDLPNAKLKIYEGIGHIQMEEIPEQTANDARDFLNQ